MFFILFAGSHSNALSALMRSKVQIKRHIINRISMYDRLNRLLSADSVWIFWIETYSFPMHPLGPKENGRLASFRSSLYFSSSSHLSGMKASGSLKFEGLWWAHHELTETAVWYVQYAFSFSKESLTPSGMNRPSMISPPSWMARRNPIGAGGKTRRFSSMHAVKYGRLVAISKFISASVLKVLRISSFSLA